MTLGIFATPKAFTGHVAAIQRNAIQSWLALDPSPQVLLMGDEPGIAEVSREFETVHLPFVERDDQGTPLVSDMFHKAGEHLNTEIICYINSDIILLEDFGHALARIRHKYFLMVGQRTDIEIEHELDFSLPDWQRIVRNDAVSTGVLHEPTGIDYFAYRKGTFTDLPPFAIGRPAWDNYMIHLARASRIPVIDASGQVLAVHQNHGYSHVSGGVSAVWSGVQAKRNIKLAGNPTRWLDIRDANWEMTHRTTRPKLALWSRRYWSTTLPVLHPSVSQIYRAVRKSLRRAAVRPRGKLKDQ